MTDTGHMRRALQLARRGRGRTSPNPMVGAVIVRDGEVVGEGYHHAVGRLHAEREALAVACDKARGATMYVTLEPCCHHGRTPPCTEAIIEAGITRVVAAMEDPNPLVGGNGFAVLEAAGIAVERGMLEAEAEALNEGFVSLVTQGRPFVTVKLAATLDGRIAAANGDSKWITGTVSRQRVHRMRATHDAVAVGIGTALADDPMLNVRTAAGNPARHQPARVVFDSRLRLPPESRLLTAAGGGPVTVVGREGGDADAAAALEAAGAHVLRVAPEDGGGRLSLDHALRALAGRGIASVFVEGGGGVAAALLRDGLVDRVVVFLAPKLLGGGGSVSMIGDLGVRRMEDLVQLSDVTIRQSGDDVMVIGRPRHRG